jgi:hypothetical protein
MAASDQLLAQGRVIVNLTIENQPKAFILIGKRLPAVRREINDAQSFMAKANSDVRATVGPYTLNIGSLIIRTSVDEGTHHPGN